MVYTEQEYRKKIQETYDVIEDAFSDVDPDIAEVEQSMGALSIRFGDGSKCILSAQPSVRQLWLALASRGTAHHFNLDTASGRWIDDKKPELELFAVLRKVLRESYEIDVPMGSR
jgi:iron donor protein CyaY